MADGTLRAIQDIEHERRRQVTEEEWTPEHDDQHDDGSMARAAACYAAHPFMPTRAWGTLPTIWPWMPRWWKPKDRRRDLVRAGALIVAEIERLDRENERSERAAPEAISNGPAGAILQTQE